VLDLLDIDTDHITLPGHLDFFNLQRRRIRVPFP
jgi:hypothetical protein